MLAYTKIKNTLQDQRNYNSKSQEEYSSSSEENNDSGWDSNEESSEVESSKDNDSSENESQETGLEELTREVNALIQDANIPPKVLTPENVTSRENLTLRDLVADIEEKCDEIDQLSMQDLDTNTPQISPSSISAQRSPTNGEIILNTSLYDNLRRFVSDKTKMFMEKFSDKLLHISDEFRVQYEDILKGFTAPHPNNENYNIAIHNLYTLLTRLLNAIDKANPHVSHNPICLTFEDLYFLPSPGQRYDFKLDGHQIQYCVIGIDFSRVNLKFTKVHNTIFSQESSCHITPDLSHEDRDNAFYGGVSFQSDVLDGNLNDGLDNNNQEAMDSRTINTELTQLFQEFYFAISLHEDFRKYCLKLDDIVMKITKMVINFTNTTEIIGGYELELEKMAATIDPDPVRSFRNTLAIANVDAEKKQLETSIAVLKPIIRRQVNTLKAFLEENNIVAGYCNDLQKYLDKYPEAINLVHFVLRDAPTVSSMLTSVWHCKKIISINIPDEASELSNYIKLLENIVYNLANSNNNLTTSNTSLTISNTNLTNNNTQLASEVATSRTQTLRYAQLMGRYQQHLAQPQAQNHPPQTEASRSLYS